MLLFGGMPAWAGGGQGGDGGPGGADSATGTGMAGGNATMFGPEGGGGGGGAGLVGGAGGPGGTPPPIPGGPAAAGGTAGTAGSPNGGDGASGGMYGGGGGGGGAHGYVGAALPLFAMQGGVIRGGMGGAGGSSTIGGGGGGGAGGWGAVVTDGGGGTLDVALTGGTGGAGGNTFNGVAVGGSGGVGLDITMAGAAITIATAVRGGPGGGNVTANEGAGGAGGVGILATGRTLTISNGASVIGGAGAANTNIVAAGGVGISGSDLAIVNAGTITGGLSGNGMTQANAVTFTGGANSLTLTSTSVIKGNAVASSTADTLALGGSTNGMFDVSTIGTAAQYQGFGVYQKVEASNWTLTGTTSATTPWQVLGGTLVISSDANLGAAAGGVTLDGGTLETTATVTSARAFTLGANGGILSPDNNTVLTLSGALSGPGGLTQAGAGTLILSGNNSYFGPTSINAGTLTVNGTITSASTINSGATLNGSGTVGAVTVADGGTLAVGDAATYSLLTTSGNVVFQSNSNFGVKIAPNNVNDFLIVHGSAALAGGTVRVAAAGGQTDYTATTEYLILNASNGITSSFAGVTSNLAFLKPSLAYDANNVFLTLSNPQFALGATTPTEQAVATALQTQFDLGNRGPLLTLVEGLNTAQAGGALSQLSGQATTGTQQTSFEAGRLFMTAMTDEAQSWARGELDTPNSVVIYDTPPTAYASPQALLTGTAFGALRDLRAQVPVSEKIRTWRAWTTGFTGASSIDDDTGAGLGFHSRTSGGALGADYQVNPNLLVGFAAGASSSNFDVPGSLTSGKLDAGHIGVYGMAKFGEVYLRDGLSYAHFLDTTSRTVNDTGVTQTEIGRFGSDQIGGTFELGWRHAIGSMAVTPFGSIGFYDTVQQAYSETGAPVNVGSDLYGLKFGERTGISMPAALGLEIDGTFRLANDWTLAPFARAAFTHEFQQRRQIDASFLSLPLSFFTASGIQPQANASTVRVGSRLRINEMMSAYASVDGTFGDRTRGVAAFAGVNFLTGVTEQPISGATTAATWTSSATPEVRFDTWHGTRGFPAAGSLASGHGSQLYNAVTFSAEGQPIDNLQVQLNAKPGYVYSRQTTQGLAGGVSTITDTTFSGTFTYVGVVGVQPFVSLNLNVPSGKSALYGSSANARMDPDFVDVGTFGEGLNIGPTLGVNLPINDKLTMSMSGGYTHHGPYIKEGSIDPFTFAQPSSNYAPGNDFSASVNVVYADGASSTQMSGAYQHETITYLDGTPSYQLGDRYTLSLSQSYAWSALTTTSATATLSYVSRNHTLDTSIPAFPIELSDSNSLTLHARIDQPFTIDRWTVGPFGTFLYRDNNSYDPANNLFSPAKTMAGAGGALKYAVSNSALLQGSVEHFWAHELPSAFVGTPSNYSRGLKLALSGTVFF